MKHFFLLICLSTHFICSHTTGADTLYRKRQGDALEAQEAKTEKSAAESSQEKFGECAICLNIMHAQQPLTHLVQQGKNIC